ncbi:MAG: hypothetical protein FWC91_10540 [Defluviitaleaceae bacterium]|nr:hypothetical protein [Defluviitaleaceae bacterium]
MPATGVAAVIAAKIAAKLALELAPVAINKCKEVVQVSKLDKRIKEIENEISEKKFEMGNYAWNKYEKTGNLDDGALELYLLSIADTTKKIKELEEEICKIEEHYTQSTESPTNMYAVEIQDIESPTNLLKVEIQEN